MGEVAWFKSSYSNDHGGNCVEGARLHSGVMAVRDSKQQPEGPALVVEAGAWGAFVAALRDGTFTA